MFHLEPCYTVRMCSIARLDLARQGRTQLAQLLRRDREALADFVVAIADFDRRKLWSELGFSCLLNFVHKGLGMSRSAAYFRQKTAELLQRYPEILEPLRDGRLCITIVPGARQGHHRREPVRDPGAVLLRLAKGREGDSGGVEPGTEPASARGRDVAALRCRARRCATGSGSRLRFACFGAIGSSTRRLECACARRECRRLRCAHVVRPANCVIEIRGRPPDPPPMERPGASVRARTGTGRSFSRSRDDSGLVHSGLVHSGLVHSGLARLERTARPAAASTSHHRLDLVPAQARVGMPRALAGAGEA